MIDTFTNQTNNIISISGGKDSTALLLMMIERKIPIYAALFFDTGWEYPITYKHLDLLEERTGVKIWHLHPRIPYNYLMTQHPIRKLTGKDKGKIHRIGEGWPRFTQRWCSSRKGKVLDYFKKPIPNACGMEGIASDEQHRCREGKNRRYPLVEWGITEDDALRYCYEKGYTWDGYYNQFKRLSCYCCPLKRMEELKTTRTLYPELWEKMLILDDMMPEPQKWFKDTRSLRVLDKQFAEEKQQTRLLWA